MRKEMCRYDIRKYSFCYRVVNVWNSLPNYLLIPSKVGWTNTGQIEFVFNFNSELIVTEGLPVCM